METKKKLQKKRPFTVSRKITDSKGVSFGKDLKLNTFLSVFSVEIYIFIRINGDKQIVNQFERNINKGVAENLKKE